MSDKGDELLDLLFSAARARKPDTEAAEAYFETRLLARITERQNNQTLLQLWSWRFIPWLATIVIIVGCVSLLYDPMHSSDLYATFTNGYEEYLLTSLLAGG